MGGQSFRTSYTGSYYLLDIDTCIRGGNRLREAGKSGVEIRLKDVAGVFGRNRSGRYPMSLVRGCGRGSLQRRYRKKKKRSRKRDRNGGCRKGGGTAWEICAPSEAMRTFFIGRDPKKLIKEIRGRNEPRNAKNLSAQELNFV